MASNASDPFQGSRQRHVISADSSSTDMEAAAARDALARARIDPEEIDVLLVHTVAPDFQLTNSAAKVHAFLGLKAECFAMQCEAAAYSFLGQLAIATAMLQVDRRRYALLIQSSAATRLVDPESSLAPLMGDGATAVVVGPVSTRGVRGAVHFTDGRYPSSLVAGVPGGTWYSDGRPVIHIADRAAMGAVLLLTVDVCKQSVDTVLERTGVAAAEIDFFCIHQGTAWLRQLAQEHTGMNHARSIDTFADTGYLFGAIMPYQLREAEESKLLRPGDQVLMFGGGTGMTYGATVVEWGP